MMTTAWAVVFVFGAEQADLNRFERDVLNPLMATRAQCRPYAVDHPLQPLFRYSTRHYRDLYLRLWIDEHWRGTGDREQREQWLLRLNRQLKQHVLLPGRERFRTSWRWPTMPGWMRPGLERAVGAVVNADVPGIY